MNLIKKIFPKSNYETKSEMRERLEKEVTYYKAFSMSTYQRVERNVEAAEAREKIALITLTNILKQSELNICSFCKNYIKCEGVNCEHYIKGTNGTINGIECNFL